MESIAQLAIASLTESVKITLIILAMMIIIELFVLKFKKRMISFVKKNRTINYIISSFFGIIPGCIGTFAMDSLYMTGLLSFGGIIAVMIATSGDEAFIMLSMAAKGEIPWSIIIVLISVLFFLGIFGAFLAEFIKKKTNMKFCTKCMIKYHKNEEFKIKHFLKEHLVNHILKKHISQIFVWLFVAIFAISLLQEHVNLEFSGVNIFYILLIASLIGILPISGPNVFLVVMFSKGMIPFSVLLANSIIQDGHGLLPIIGFSIEDAVKIKLFNFMFGITVGSILLLAGI